MKGTKSDPGPSAHTLPSTCVARGFAPFMLVKGLLQRPQLQVNDFMILVATAALASFFTSGLAVRVRACKAGRLHKLQTAGDSAFFSASNSPRSRAPRKPPLAGMKSNEFAGGCCPLLECGLGRTLGTSVLFSRRPVARAGTRPSAQAGPLACGPPRKARDLVSPFKALVSLSLVCLSLFLSVSVALCLYLASALAHCLRLLPQPG